MGREMTYDTKLEVEGGQRFTRGEGEKGHHLKGLQEKQYPQVLVRTGREGNGPIEG